MKIEWTATHTAEIDIDLAEEDYYDYMDIRDNPTDEDTAGYAIWEAIRHNIITDIDIDNIPVEVWGKCAKALKDRIGGIQLKMNLEE